MTTIRAVDLRLVPVALTAWVVAAIAGQIVVPGRWMPIPGSLERRVAGLLIVGAVCAACATVAGVWRLAHRHERLPLASQLAACTAVGTVVVASVLLTLSAYARSGLAHALVEMRTIEVRAQVSDEPTVVEGMTGARLRVDLALRQWRSAPDGPWQPGGGVPVTIWLAQGEHRPTAVDSDEVDPAWLSSVNVVGRITNTLDGRLELRGTTDLRVTDPPGWSAWSAAMRSALVDACAGLSAQGRALVPGIAVGDTDALSSDLRDAMRQSGLTHLTAVSGGHFAILAAVLERLAARAGVPRRTRAVLVGCALVGLGILVRPEPSVLRAIVMASVGLAAMLAGRPSQALPALCAAVIVLCVAQPELAISLGFLLSVSATLGLVLWARPLDQWLEPHLDGRWTSWVRGPLAVAIAAQLACAPVLVLIQPAVSWIAVLANVLAAPAVAPATIIALGATLLAVPWPAAAGVLAWIASVFTGWIARVAEVAAAVPGGSLPWPGGVQGALLLAALGVSVWCIVRWHGDAIWLLRWWGRSVRLEWERWRRVR